MATTTTTSTNTSGIANNLNTPARADEDGGAFESFSKDDRDDDVSVDCRTIGSSYHEEYIQVYRERILVGGSFFPPGNSESGSGRWEWNGMLLDISSLFLDTKSGTDSSPLCSRPNSNSIVAIFPPHRSIDDFENDEIIIARNPSISSYFPAYFSDTSASSVSNETRLDEWLVILGIEKLSISKIQKLEWNLLDKKAKKWVQTMKIIFSGHCDQMLCGKTTDETKEICFNETMKGCVMQLLNFGKAVAIGRRSPEKLFRILDMYDVMAKALARLEVLITDDVAINEARDVLSGLGEAACGMLAEFQNAVQSETSSKPMQSGEIHHLTWYVMNYVNLIVDCVNYSETLNLLEIREDDDQLEAL
nr:exocyst complex component exo70a1 [Quercus suber]